MKKININDNNIIEYTVSIVISFIIFIVPTLLVPQEVFLNNNLLKFTALSSGGLFLLIVFVILLRYKKIRLDGIDITLGFFYIFVVISTILSIDFNKSIFGEIYRNEGLIAISTYMLIYYFSKHYFKEYKKFIPICIIISICLCIYAIMQYYDLRPIYDAFKFYYRKGFASGTFGNSNFMGSFVSIIVPLTLILYILKGDIKYLICSLISFTAMLCARGKKLMGSFWSYLFNCIDLLYI